MNQYFSLVDSGDFVGALAMASPDLEMAFASVDGVSLHGGVAELGRYLETRIPRLHRVPVTHATTHTEFAFGDSLEPDGSLNARFVAVMQFTDDGLITRYHAAVFADDVSGSS